MKEERFPHTRKPLRRQKLQVAEGGSFGATEESAATGVQRARRRDSCTEDRCQPALTSLGGLSAHPPGWAGLRPGGGNSFWGHADLRCVESKQTASKGSELPVTRSKQARIYQGQKKASGAPCIPEDHGSQGCSHEVLREVLGLVQPDTMGVILRHPSRGHHSAAT